jgi:hypothetical protein
MPEIPPTVPPGQPPDTGATPEPGALVLITLGLGTWLACRTSRRDV